MANAHDFKEDFAAVSRVALASAERLLTAWLPEGKRMVREFKCGDLSGRSGTSLSINLDTGIWKDFNQGDGGADLVSLYAAIEGLEQWDACQQLAAQLGVTLRSTGAQSSAPTTPRDSAAPARAEGGVNVPSQTSDETPSEPRSEWEPIVPVPEDAGPAPVAHSRRGRPERTWTYTDQVGRVLGVVYRFKTSDGGKEVLPCVFARHRETGTIDWRWMQWPEPRPLYLTAPLSGDKVVLIVEGEKCADAAFGVELLRERLDIVSWPGGGKATSKVDWSVLAGRKVILWPDCDAKRIKLTAEQRKAGVDPDSQPIAPEAEQPGTVAVEQIAKHLVKHQARAVRIVQIPAPGEKPDGWDIADEIEQGTTPEALWAMLGQRRVPTCLQPAEKPEGAATPPAARASEGSSRAATKPSSARTSRQAHGLANWRAELIQKPRGGLDDCRENVYLILKHHPDWCGIVAYDEFANRVVKQRETPTGLPTGPWEIRDDHRLGLWLAQHLGLVIKGDGAITGGVGMTGDDNRIDPVKDYLTGLRWDGTSRLETWLEQIMKAAKLNPRSGEYLAAVGRKFMIGAVARVFKPGVKMDNMLVFEGGQGRGKSTAVSILGGAWYSDTPLDLDSKDAFMALSGCWWLEWGEMDALSRAEVTRVKGFITSSKDRYRPPYERREVDVHRRCIFVGTTNQYEYLKDSTGGRRFWCVRIDGEVDLDRLRRERDQLFAEAVHRFNAGEVWHLTSQEQRDLASPEQEHREIADPWQAVIQRWLNEPEVSLLGRWYAHSILIEGVKVPVDKIDSARNMSMRIAGIMTRLGYVKRRDTGGERAYYYERADATQPAATAHADDEGDDSPL
jgi:hypothetical protein